MTIRNFWRKKLNLLVKFLAIKTLKKYNPGIVAVTGTVGKTSTKDAIYSILRHQRRVRANQGNFNNELGLPLTILGDYKEIKGVFFWPKVIWQSFINLIKKSDYPEILILEYAADRPGDIRYLLSIARPQISVVTAVGDIPVHVEFYSGPDAVAREKSRIVEALPSTGFAILNYDDESVYRMREKTRAHSMTFGFNEGAELRIINFENLSEELPLGGFKPAGIAFKLEHNRNFVPIRLRNVYGRAQAYAIAAAASVGLAFGINLVRIAEAIQFYEPPHSRMKLLPGIKNTYIIDDSYNASPLSMHAAIDTIKDLKAKRKIGVLGDMLELGNHTNAAHEFIGRLCPKVLSILITVGLRAKFIADAAIKAGLKSDHVYSFDTADQAKLEVQGLLEKGDLILIKGSRAMQLDRVVKEIQQIN